MSIPAVVQPKACNPAGVSEWREPLWGTCLCLTVWHPRRAPLWLLAYAGVCVAAFLLQMFSSVANVEVNIAVRLYGGGNLSRSLSALQAGSWGLFEGVRFGSLK